MITAKTFGSKKDLRALLLPRGQHERLVGALNQTAADAVEIFREETPKSSGRTAEAWAMVPGTLRRPIALVVNAYKERGYLVMAGIEYGTPAHVIRPRHGKALVFAADRSSVAEGRVHRGEARQLNPVRAQLAQRPSGSLRRLHMPQGEGIKSPIRYGNAIRIPGKRTRAIVASDLRTGTPLFRNSRGGLHGGGPNAERVVIVSMVRHPGTKPNPVVRRNLGVLRELLRARVADAVRAR